MSIIKFIQRNWGGHHWMFDIWSLLGKILLVLSLLAMILSAIKYIPSIIKKIRKKQYKFDMDYEDICFSLFSDQNSPKRDMRLCLFVYNLRIVNCSDKPNTLKSIELFYQHDGKRHQTESTIVQTKIEPKSGELVITLWNGIDAILVKPWYNIRQKLGGNETLQPGAVFHGSSIFLFEPCVKDAHSIKTLSLIVRDFHGNESVHPFDIDEGLFVSLNKGFMVMNI